MTNGGSDGQVSVSVNGGNGPFSYLWSSGNTNAAVLALSASTYTVTVTDASGCSSTASSTVNEPLPMVLVPASITAACGSSNGTASIAVNGGTPGYSYLWSNGVTSAANANIASGSYNVTVTDANGCTSLSAVNVSNSAGPVVLESCTKPARTTKN